MTDTENSQSGAAGELWEGNNRWVGARGVEHADTYVDDGSDPGDRTADTKAIVVVMITIVLFAVHFISGFTFDI
ncbi:MAG: hypothetical protein GXP16_10910 [Gammaproteobacteria bacterium]|nr:hypothetical protein [Gammaproteobacteria bacterium]